MAALRPGQPPSSVLITSCQGSWPPLSVLEKILVNAIECFRRKQSPPAATAPDSLWQTVPLWPQGGVGLGRSYSKKNALTLTPFQEVSGPGLVSLRTAEQVTHYTTPLTIRAGGTEIQDLLHLPSCAPQRDKAVFTQKKGILFSLGQRCHPLAQLHTYEAVYTQKGCLLLICTKGAIWPNCNPGSWPFCPLPTRLGSMTPSTGQREKPSPMLSAISSLLGKLLCPQAHVSASGLAIDERTKGSHHKPSSTNQILLLENWN